MLEMRDYVQFIGRDNETIRLMDYLICAVHKLWNWLGPIWGSTLAIAGGLASVDKSLHVVRASWKWCVSKYDGKALTALEEARRQVKLAHRPPVVMLPVSLEEIARAVGRNKKCVYKSLRRLERQEKVYEVKDGWCLGKRPPGA